MAAGRVHAVMQNLVISAPYGNYIQPQGATPTLGTFTNEPRPGRWLRVAKTVRFYPKIGAWTNQIGLRNPGIDAAPDCDGTKILSIHGFDSDDWYWLLAKAPHKHPSRGRAEPQLSERSWRGRLPA